MTTNTKPLTIRAAIIRLTDATFSSAIRQVKGEICIYKGFFYRPPLSADDYAQTWLAEAACVGITLRLVGVTTEDYIPFKGGAPVWKQNHFCARFVLC
jgi:hypothetical protein